jgi:hypothetical protein
MEEKSMTTKIVSKETTQISINENSKELGR